MRMESKLERLLREERFTVTAQMLFDGEQDEQAVRQAGIGLAEYVDALMVPDNQRGSVALSSIAGAAILTQNGIEAGLHLACRDRNRIALESDLIGAHALGIHNIVCLTGDHPQLGNRPEAKPVYDLDSIQLLALVKRLREQGSISGETTRSLSFCIGAVENPFADPLEFRVARLAKKFEAGADFILTQVIFDLDRFKRFMERVREEGLHRKGKIIASLMPLGSVTHALELSRQPGVLIPQDVIKTMDSGGRQAGLDLCQKYIETLRQVEGISGVHIVFKDWEDIIDILKNGGLALRPKGFSS